MTSQVARLRTQLLPFDGGNWGSMATYPTSSNPFPSRLACLAALIAAGLPLRCVTVSAPGMYDTHAYQATDLGNLPGKQISTVAGIDDQNRVVGWSTTTNFPPA